MRLARMAVVDLSLSNSELLDTSKLLEKDSIQIQIQAVPVMRSKMLVTATIPLLEPLAFDADGSVRIPEDPRVALEAAIREVADMASIATGGPRRISSARPEFGLLELSAEEREAIYQHEPLHVPHPVSGIVASAFRPLALGDLPFGALADRPDGVRLLAEALSTDHPTGRFRELCRLFERSFAAGPHDLVSLVSQFLAFYKSLEFSVGEIEHWFDHLRHLSTHADRREQFAVAGDIVPVLSRVQFAAYDVLMNKASWRDSTVDRRAVWRPSIAPLRDGGVALEAAGAAPVSWQLLDCFGVFPLDTSMVFGPPEGWVVHQPTERLGSAGSFEVVESFANGRVAGQ